MRRQLAVERLIKRFVRNKRYGKLLGLQRQLLHEHFLQQYGTCPNCGKKRRAGDCH